MESVEIVITHFGAVAMIQLMCLAGAALCVVNILIKKRS